MIEVVSPPAPAMEAVAAPVMEAGSAPAPVMEEVIGDGAGDEGV